jgi:hypothetical protein
VARQKALLFFACLGACAPERAALPPEPPPASEPPVLYSPLQLGHYTTADGTFGLVIDRSGPTPRLRMDGSRQIVELTPVEDWKGDTYEGTTFFSPDGIALVFVDRAGPLTLWPRRDKRPLLRDGDTTPLPAANVRGRFREAPDPAREFIAAVAPYVVVDRYPELTADDAGKLDVVERMLKEAPEEMFFRVVKPDSGAVHIFDTRSQSDAETMRLAEGIPWQKDATGLGRFGVAVTAYPGILHPGSPTTLRLEGFPRPLAVGTVALVWALRGSTLILVTADGGSFELPTDRFRYSESRFAAALVRELPPVETWPTEVQHVTVSADAIKNRRADLGVAPAALARLATLTEDWVRCGNDFLKTVGADRQRALTLRQAVSKEREHYKRMELTRELQALDDRWRPRVAEHCWPNLQSFETSYLAILEQRQTRLTELYARVRAAHAQRAAKKR